jgi:hypothetical protein
MFLVTIKNNPKQTEIKASTKTFWIDQLDPILNTSLLTVESSKNIQYETRLV